MHIVVLSLLMSVYSFYTHASYTEVALTGPLPQESSWQEYPLVRDERGEPGIIAINPHGSDLYAFTKLFTTQVGDDGLHTYRLRGIRHSQIRTFDGRLLDELQYTDDRQGDFDRTSMGGFSKHYWATRSMSAAGEQFIAFTKQDTVLLAKITLSNYGTLDATYTYIVRHYQPQKRDMVLITLKKQPSMVKVSPSGAYIVIIYAVGESQTISIFEALSGTCVHTANLGAASIEKIVFIGVECKIAYRSTYENRGHYAFNCVTKIGQFDQLVKENLLKDQQAVIEHYPQARIFQK